MQIRTYKYKPTGAKVQAIQFDGTEDTVKKILELAGADVCDLIQRGKVTAHVEKWWYVVRLKYGEKKITQYPPHLFEILFEEVVNSTEKVGDSTSLNKTKDGNKSKIPAGQLQHQPGTAED